MKTTWVGQEKLIQIGTNLYRISEESESAATEYEWAQCVLDQPEVTYPNGRNSHEAAGEVLDRAEDTLMNYQVWTAYRAHLA